MLQTSRVDGLVEAARARLDRLSPEAAYRETTAGAVLVDTRCGDDRRRTGGIPGSIAIPLSVLPWRAWIRPRIMPTPGFLTRRDG